MGIFRGVDGQISSKRVVGVIGSTLSGGVLLFLAIRAEFMFSAISEPTADLLKFALGAFLALLTAGVAEQFAKRNTPESVQDVAKSDATLK